MAACRPLPGLLAALVVLGTLHLAAGPAPGQDNISSDVITADSLTDEQQQRVEAYLSNWCEQLHTGSATEIARARQRLAEPLNNPAEPSSTFIDFFSPKLAECLAEGLDADRLIVRLNAMIVVTYMVSEEAMPLINRGLVDDNPGVRYWAAKAMQRLGKRETWSRQQQTALLERLIERLGDEQTGWVVQQLMLATVELNVPETAGEVLGALNRRVQVHFDNPGRPIQAEQAGLERLYQELIGADEPDRDILRQLARTGYRYMRLAGTHLADGRIPEQYQAGYGEVIGVADTIMRTVHEELNGSQNLPEAPSQAVQQQDWDRVLVIADRWEQVLQSAPFNFERAALALAPADDENEQAEDGNENTESTSEPVPPGNVE